MGLSITAATLIRKELNDITLLDNRTIEKLGYDEPAIQELANQLAALAEMFNGITHLSFTDQELKARTSSEQFRVARLLKTVRNETDDIIPDTRSVQSNSSLLTSVHFFGLGKKATPPAPARDKTPSFNYGG